MTPDVWRLKVPTNIVGMPKAPNDAAMASEGRVLHDVGYHEPGERDADIVFIVLLSLDSGRYYMLSTRTGLLPRLPIDSRSFSLR
jgi:hypothetical protein